MRFAVPTAGPLADARAALSTEAGLRRWWDPAATLAAGRMAPGFDGPEAGVVAEGDAIRWEGDAGAVRFALREGAVDVDVVAPEVPGHALPELRLAWDDALLGLGHALAHPGPMGWARWEAPVALSFGDAWSRLAPEGLADLRPGDARDVRFAGETRLAIGVAAHPPRTLAFRLPDVDDALVRLRVQPGESVNAASVAVLRPGGAPFPGDGQAWLGRVFRMLWAERGGG